MTDILANLGKQRLAGAKARHRHDWHAGLGLHRRGRRECICGVEMFEAGYLYHCKCGVVRDDAKSRAGTSARRLGHDQERRIERVYGPRKVGEFGDAIDLLGRDFMWQSKATRGAMRGSIPDGATWGAVKSAGWMSRPLEAMLLLRQDLRPLLISSWVRPGVKPVDLIVVRSVDWRELHGEAPTTEYMAMTGAHFLDVHGRDEP